MSLTHEQRYLLEELREYLQRVEKVVPRYDIDLDAIAIEYGGSGYKVQKQDALPDRARQRRSVFIKSEVKTWIPEEE